MKKKVFVYFLLLCICSASVFSQTSENKKSDEKSSGKSALVGSALSALRLSSGYTNAYPLYNMNQYSKIAAGGFLALEHTILPGLYTNFDAGLYGKFSYQNYIPYNLQLNSLNACTFASGLFCQKNLPDDFAVFFSLGAGFMISMLDFTSAEGKEIDDVYYDFALEVDLFIRKKVYGNNTFFLLMGPGCHFSFYNEESKNFCSMGPAFSLSIDFKPVKKK